MVWKLIRITIQVIIYVYAEVRFFVVTCQRFGKCIYPRHEQLGNSRIAHGEFGKNTITMKDYIFAKRLTNINNELYSYFNLMSFQTISSFIYDLKQFENLQVIGLT